MNLKRIFGAILTLLGTAGIIYSAHFFIVSNGNDYNMRAFAIYGIIGIIFFIAGISLVRTTKDEA